MHLVLLYDIFTTMKFLLPLLFFLTLFIEIYWNYLIVLTTYIFLRNINIMREEVNCNVLMVYA